MDMQLILKISVSGWVAFCVPLDTY